MVIETDLDIKKQVGTLEKVTMTGKNELLVETKRKTRTEKLVSNSAKQIIVIEEDKL